MPTGLLVITIFFVCLSTGAAATVWSVRRRRRQLRSVWGTALEARGFSQSTATHLGDAHWTGTWRERQVVIGYYAGNFRDDDQLGQAGLLVMMHVGSKPTFEDTVPPDVPHAQVFSTDGLLPGSIVDLVIRAGFGGPWDGHGVRAVLPKSSSLDDLEQALDEVASWAAQR